MIQLPALSLAAKIAGGAALVVILTLATLWQLSERRADRLVTANQVLRANLAQCRANRAELESAIEAQNRALEAFEAEGVARIAETQDRLSEREIERAVAQARAQWLRERPIQGTTQCERVLNVISAARGRE